jgi:hypothetical protein
VLLSFGRFEKTGKKALWAGETFSLGREKK